MHTFDGPDHMGTTYCAHASLSLSLPHPRSDAFKRTGASWVEGERSGRLISTAVSHLGVYTHLQHRRLVKSHPRLLCLP